MQRFIPITSANNYEEEHYFTVWDDIGDIFGPGTGFRNVFAPPPAPANYFDNGMGLVWIFDLGTGGANTISDYHSFVPISLTPSATPTGTPLTATPTRTPSQTRTVTPTPSRTVSSTATQTPCSFTVALTEGFETGTLNSFSSTGSPAGPPSTPPRTPASSRPSPAM